MNDGNVKYMKEALVRDMIIYLCDAYGRSLADAMNTVYSSETFRMLEDDDNFLYTQSPVYLSDCLDKELKFGKIYG